MMLSRACRSPSAHEAPPQTMQTDSLVVAGCFDFDEESAEGEAVDRRRLSRPYWKNLQELCAITPFSFHPGLNKFESR